MSESPVGLVLGSVLAPEHLKDVARSGEELGFGRLWMAEDYYFTGGISGAATVLSATERMPVGLGVVSAVARHPALLAMEVATMARIYPGRVVPAIGLGLADWLRQMGIHPNSTLGALRESLTSMRALLAGEEIDRQRRQLPLRPHPARIPGRGAALHGHHGTEDAAALGRGRRRHGAVGGCQPLVRDLGPRAHRRGRRAWAAATPSAHKVSTFTLFAVDEDAEKARADIRATLGFFLETMANSSLIKVLGIRDQLLELAAGGPEALAAGLPEDWVDDYAVVGDPAECAQKIQKLIDAGSDTVELFPVPERATEYTQLAGEQVLPQLARALQHQ